PDEARAVEAAERLDAERRLGVLARPAPDVGVADEVHARVQNAELPGAEVWKRESRDGVLHVLLLPALEPEDLGDGVGGSSGSRAGSSSTWRTPSRLSRFHTSAPGSSAFWTRACT